MPTSKSNKGSKPAAFKKQGGGAAKTVTLKPGSNKPQIANMKQQASLSKGGPKKAPTVTPKPGSNKPQLDNMRSMGGKRGNGGDNPFGSSK